MSCFSRSSPIMTRCMFGYDENAEAKACMSLSTPFARGTSYRGAEFFWCRQVFGWRALFHQQLTTLHRPEFVRTLKYQFHEKGTKMKLRSREESPIIRMLEQTPIFSSLTKKQLKSILALSYELKFQAGQNIVDEGKPGLGFYLLVDGRAEVRHGDKVLSTLVRGQFFGEMTLLDEQPRSADVVAIEPTRCLVFPAWDFHGLIIQYPKMARAIMTEMARRLRLTNQAFSQ